jgi:serine/threonine protein phosphatase PrpC
VKIHTHTLYDQGTAEYSEDMFFIRMIDGVGGPHLIAVVADGVSGLYDPDEGPRLFSGRTGGQLVCEAVRNAVSAIGIGDTIESLILMANLRAREFITHYQLPIQSSDLLPGAAFVFAKIDGKKIRIIQGVDCVAVWQRENGNIGATRNQVFLHDLRVKKIIADLMIQHGGDREKVWQELTPTLAELRLRHVNKRGGYALLNGQEGLHGCYRRMTLLRKRTKRLFLFSDGLVPFMDTRNRKFLGEMVIELFNQGGLTAILKRTREIEEKEKGTSHIYHAEATGIAIEF